MQEHAFAADLAVEMLSKEVTIWFVSAPGYTNKENVTSRCLGFADLSDSDSVGQLFQVGSKATLYFEQPKPTVEPQGWHCVV